MSYLHHLKELATNSRKNSYIDQICSVPSYICHNLDCVPLSRTFSFSGPEGPELYATMLISLAQFFHFNHISFLAAPWTQQTSDHGTLAVTDSFSFYPSPMQELSTVPASLPPTPVLLWWDILRQAFLGYSLKAATLLPVFHFLSHVSFLHCSYCYLTYWLFYLFVPMAATGLCRQGSQCVLTYVHLERGYCMIRKFPSHRTVEKIKRVIYVTPYPGKKKHKIYTKHWGTFLIHLLIYVLMCMCVCWRWGCPWKSEEGFRNWVYRWLWSA